MSALKCYIIACPLTSTIALTDRRKNLIIATIWTGNCAMLVGADLLGVRWVLDPKFHISTPVGNPAAGRGLRFFETFFIDGISSLVIFSSYVKILIVVHRHHLLIGNQLAVSVTAGAATTSDLHLPNYQPVLHGYCVLHLPGVANFQPGLATSDWYLTMSTWLLSASGLINGSLYILFYKSTRRYF